MRVIWRLTARRRDAEASAWARWGSDDHQCQPGSAHGCVQQAQPSPLQQPARVRPYHAGQPDAGAELPLAALVRRDGTPVVLVSASGDIGIVTIGRGEDVDVSLPESVVSQLHARLHWDAERGGHVLTDAGSTNGTYINRRRITGPVMLLNGMQIHLGSVALSYQRPFQAVP